MPKYGIVSITPSLKGKKFSTINHLYNALGQNTGNLLFTNAVWRQIDGEKKRISFNFDSDIVNDTFDAVIVPAANWVNPQIDLGHLASPFEKLKIPVVLIGLGAQNLEGQPTHILKEGTLRFLRAVFENCVSVSVRGEYTRSILKKLGLSNVEVTGCPSLYHTFRSFQKPTPTDFSLERCLIHATRFSAGHGPFAKNASPNRELFRFGYSNRLDILFQSELEEMALLLGYPTDEMLDDRIISLLKLIYSADEWDELRAYIMSHGKTFLDIEEWAEAAAAYQFVLGTRLHGTIMALNSGTPAVLLHHDSRTQELCDFAKIPSFDANRFELTAKKVASAYENIDLDRYYRTRDENKSIYKSFLTSNNVEFNAF